MRRHVSSFGDYEENIILSFIYPIIQNVGRKTEVDKSIDISHVALEGRMVYVSSIKSIRNELIC